MTTSPTLFQQNSYWAPQNVGNLVKEATPSESIITEAPEEKVKRLLDDWSQRIQLCADEAGDARLLALESDLLDLRDELTYALHETLLN